MKFRSPPQDTINEFLAKEKATGRRYCNRIFCADGWSASVQAGDSGWYSSGEIGDFSSVEVGYWSADEPELNNRSADGVVAGFVPVEIVNKIIARHGGLR